MSQLGVSIDTMSGLPAGLTFDRDVRWVGSPEQRDVRMRPLPVFVWSARAAQPLTAAAPRGVIAFVFTLCDKRHQMVLWCDMNLL